MIFFHILYHFLILAHFKTLSCGFYLGMTVWNTFITIRDVILLLVLIFYTITSLQDLTVILSVTLSYVKLVFLNI